MCGKSSQGQMMYFPVLQYFPAYVEKNLFLSSFFSVVLQRHWFIKNTPRVFLMGHWAVGPRDLRASLLFIKRTVKSYVICIKVIKRLISFTNKNIYSVNRMCPNTEPWGTPHDDAYVPDVWMLLASLLQHWSLFHTMKAVSQSGTDPGSRKTQCGRFSHTVWSITHSSQVQQLWPEPAAVDSSFETFKSTVSVERIFWNTDWKTWYNLWSSRKEVSRSVTG